MGLSEKVSHAGKVAALLVAHPGQVRHVPEWARNVHTPTIESGLPWLPFDVIGMLDEKVTSDSRVFEYGGGGSTVWFAQRAGEVVTVEDDADWCDSIAKSCASFQSTRLVHEPDPKSEGYQDAASRAGGPWDVVVVDGRQRVECVRRAAATVRPGGLLILDDTERARYQPAFDVLAAWPHRTYRGLAPMKPMPAQTTVWTKP